MKSNTKYMKKISVIALFSMTFGCIYAQNLVDNGDFETVSGKAKKLGSIEAADGWMIPTAAKPDLFIAGKIPEINTPDNIYGSEEPKSGSNYAGIVGFSYGDKIPRTYLMVRLNEPLKKGGKYCVQYALSLAEGSKYACDNMGAVLSKKEYGLDAKASLIEKPSVVSNKSFSQNFGWDKVCGYYLAEGGEKYLIIGNFASNDKVKSVKNRPPKEVKAEQVIGAYYYIDDVEVVELLGDMACDCATSDQTETYSTMIYQKQITFEEKMTPADKVSSTELYFGFGDDELTFLAQDLLKSVVEVLKANPKMRIQIMGHSDKLEDKVGLKKPEYSDMANKRMAAVMEYFKAMGIDETRLIPASQGSNVPNPDIRDYDDEEMMQAKNRRVTFKAL